jgi:hypothetical protein
MKTDAYAALAILFTVVTTQATALAQNCWTPIKNWGGTYSLSGNGTNTCNGATETTDEAVNAIARVPLWSVTCIGAEWFGIATDEVSANA